MLTVSTSGRHLESKRKIKLITDQTQLHILSQNKYDNHFGAVSPPLPFSFFLSFLFFSFFFFFRQSILSVPPIENMYSRIKWVFNNGVLYSVVHFFFLLVLSLISFLLLLVFVKDALNFFYWQRPLCFSLTAAMSVSLCCEGWRQTLNPIQALIKGYSFIRMQINNPFEIKHHQSEGHQYD